MIAWLSAGQRSTERRAPPPDAPAPRSSIVARLSAALQVTGRHVRFSFNPRGVVSRRALQACGSRRGKDAAGRSREPQGAIKERPPGRRGGPLRRGTANWRASSLVFARPRCSTTIIIERPISTSSKRGSIRSSTSSFRAIARGGGRIGCSTQSGTEDLSRRESERPAAAIALFAVRRARGAASQARISTPSGTARPMAWPRTRTRCRTISNTGSVRSAQFPNSTPNITWRPTRTSPRRASIRSSISCFAAIARAAIPRPGSTPNSTGSAI